MIKSQKTKKARGRTVKGTDDGTARLRLSLPQVDCELTSKFDHGYTNGKLRKDRAYVVAQSFKNLKHLIMNALIPLVSHLRGRRMGGFVGNGHRMPIPIQASACNGNLNRQRKFLVSARPAASSHLQASQSQQRPNICLPTCPGRCSSCCHCGVRTRLVRGRHCS